MRFSVHGHECGRQFSSGTEHTRGPERVYLQREVVSHWPHKHWVRANRLCTTFFDTRSASANTSESITPARSYRPKRHWPFSPIERELAETHRQCIDGRSSLSGVKRSCPPAVIRCPGGVRGISRYSWGPARATHNGVFLHNDLCPL